MAVKNTVEHVLQNQVPVGAENDDYDADDGTQIPRLFFSKKKPFRHAKYALNQNF